MTSTVRVAVRRLVRAVAAGAIACGALAGLAGPAVAHDQLVASDPADGAHLATSPAAIRLTFSDEVLEIDPQMIVRNGAGETVASGTPQIARNVITLALDPLPAGSYRAAWRVVSSDGHPIEGALSFTVGDPTPGTGDGSATPSGASSPVSAATPSAVATGSRSSAGALPVVFGAVIAIVVVGAGAAIVLLRRRANRKDPA